MPDDLGCGELEAEIQTERKPLLLAYVRRDYDYTACREALEQMLENNGHALRVVLLDEDSVETCSRLGIVGAPTFLLYFQGQELGRILGKTDSGTLNAFFWRKLPDFRMEKESVISEKGRLERCPLLQRSSGAKES